MKLWIDDTREAPDESWTVARKVQSAIQALYAFHFDEISIDHDIENRPSDETFTPVAYFLGEKFGNDSRLDDTVITVHSVNPVGSKEIKEILLDYGLHAEWKPYLK